MLKKLFRYVANVGFESVRTVTSRLGSISDSRYLADDVEAPRLCGHSQCKELLYQLANRPGMKVLEIGSREVTGRSEARSRFDQASYTGFDFYAGNNVDVVGDVHKLSSYFPADTKFDLIYSLACFEHFAMPWVVAEEIGKMLKVGGHVFVETHFSYCSHERPWNFFQFSDKALEVLFSPALGFERIDSGMSNPIVGRFSRFADQYLRYKMVPRLYCHSEFFGRKVADVGTIDWRSTDIGLLVGATAYPKPGFRE